MFQTITNIFKVGDLRTKIIFTLLMLVVFRIGSFVPVPNINVAALQQYAETSDILGFLNTFTGGALNQFSIFAMGIMPYITASIVMQLLAMDVVPKVAQWAKEGETGRRKIAQWTRYGTVLLALIQGAGMSIGFNNLIPGLVINPTFATYTIIALTLTAGTAFLMWLGEQITEKGIGNGISIIIFAGIVAVIPTGTRQILQSEFINSGDQIFLSIIKVLLIIFFIVLITMAIIYVHQGVRKVPIQYAKRVVGRKMYGGQSTHLPLKVNAAGVIPIIFALSIIIFPQSIANFWAGNPIADWVRTEFDYRRPLGMSFYAFLIIAFTYFYTYVQIQPPQMADNLKKNGGYIPGIRPGKTTEIYLYRIMNRITLVGALFLAVVSIMPVFFTLVSNLPPSIQIGGTSLLIVIGVALDTMKQIESQLIKRHYKGFIR